MHWGPSGSAAREGGAIAQGGTDVKLDQKCINCKQPVKDGKITHLKGCPDFSRNVTR